MRTPIKNENKQMPFIKEPPGYLPEEK